MTIDFLDLAVPEPGQWQQVSDGIFWLRMPLPFDLDHINLYLIQDDDPLSGSKGYALIDTGIGVGQTEALWERILTALDGPITKVIVTHMHPDHIGMAGYLVHKYRVALYMSQTEYLFARALNSGHTGGTDWQEDEHLLRCGMSAAYIADAKEKRNHSAGPAQLIRPIPVQYVRLQHNDEIILGDGKWRVMIGKGHSPEHVCLYNQQSKVLISGDHVLPIITPNIGVYSTEPNANTLEMYLDTLPQFKQLAEDTLVLPSHKQPFFGLHERVDDLIAHHLEHLANISAFCRQGRTVQDCLPVLFKRQLNEHNLFFAIAEALSHLNYLYFNNTLTRQLNDQGHYVFTLAKAA